MQLPFCCWFLIVVLPQVQHGGPDGGKGGGHEALEQGRSDRLAHWVHCRALRGGGEDVASSGQERLLRHVLVQVHSKRKGKNQ